MVNHLLLFLISSKNTFKRSGVFHSHYRRYSPWLEVLLGGRTMATDWTWCVTISNSKMALPQRCRIAVLWERTWVQERRVGNTQSYCQTWRQVVSRDSETIPILNSSSSMKWCMSCSVIQSSKSCSAMPRDFVLSLFFYLSLIMIMIAACHPSLMGLSVSARLLSLFP